MTSSGGGGGVVSAGFPSMSDKEDWSAKTTVRRKSSGVKKRPTLDNFAQDDLGKLPHNSCAAELATGSAQQAVANSGASHSAIKYDQQTLNKALNELMNGRDAAGKKLSVRTTAEKYCVPKSTLHRHLKTMLISEESETRDVALKPSALRKTIRELQAAASQAVEPPPDAGDVPSSAALDDVKSARYVGGAGSDELRSAESDQTSSSDALEASRNTGASISDRRNVDAGGDAFGSTAVLGSRTIEPTHAEHARSDLERSAPNLRATLSGNGEREVSTASRPARLGPPDSALHDSDVQMLESSSVFRTPHHAPGSWMIPYAGSQGASASLLYRLRAEDHFSRPSAASGALEPPSGLATGRPMVHLPPPQRGHYRSASTIPALPHHAAQDVSFSTSMAPLQEPAPAIGASSSLGREREPKRHGIESESMEHEPSLPESERHKHRKVFHEAALNEPAAVESEANRRRDRLVALEVEIERVKNDMSSMQNRLVALEHEFFRLRQDAALPSAGQQAGKLHSRAMQQ
mmetsp:Transcript_7835/g.20717  ORF Transcript_7835/g.20717 Transcript_7835/m.20717 type:complete len:521 (-) Transcript_7835:71-1633(-)